MSRRLPLNDWERGNNLTAVFSDDRRHRYLLGRGNRSVETGADADPGIVTFICLNPSTDDETWDDQTANRCAGYAKGWGYRGLLIVNLFALRSTDKTALVEHPDPVGDRNDRFLNLAVRAGGLVVAAWGDPPGRVGRARALEVASRFGGADCDAELFCLGLIGGGHPRHPSRAGGDLAPAPFPGYE